MAKAKYRIISSDSELDKAEAPELKEELVVLDEWLIEGEAVAFYEHEMSHGEHEDFELSDKVFDKQGNFLRIKRGGRAYEYLSRCTRDGDGQRVWASAEACEKRIKPLGKSVTSKMVAAADKANYGGNSSAEEAESDAEGKSEEA